MIDEVGQGKISRRVASVAHVMLLASWGCGSSTGVGGSMCGAASGQPGGVGQSLSLAPGEICTLVSADAEALEIEASAVTAQYLVVIQSGSRTPGATTSLRLETQAVALAANRAPTTETSVRPAPTANAISQGAASQAELTFRKNARRALSRARPLRAGRKNARPGARASIAADATRGVGDTLVFHNTVGTDLSVECEGLYDVTTVVRAMGSNFGILEDIEAAGPVSPAQYAQVLQTLDNSVYPINTTYFGTPADLDSNGLVWVMFTPVVNRVTPRGSATRVSGFFNPSDLSDSATCTASNEGEILYVAAADPTGRFSDPVPTSFATARAIGVAAHELEHLISAEQRVVISGGSFADLEDAWLGEGLAHSAETFVGFSLSGLSPGQNYPFIQLSADRPTFDAYHFPNFRRAGYYLADSNGTLALGDSEGEDPGGISSLEMRGFGWLFLRWLSDQYAPSTGGVLGGPAEESMFRALASGGAGRARGIANVEQAAAAIGAPPDWESLLSQYALAPLADDHEGQTDASTQLTSFRLRETFVELNREFGIEQPFSAVFPLLKTDVPLNDLTNSGVDFDLKAATGRYFVLESTGPHPPIRVALTTPSGGSVPVSARAQLILHRTR